MERLGTVRRFDKRGVWLAAGLLALAGSTWTAFSHPGSWEEDAYIFFRYAENLAAGEGLAFNPGERSFGVTSPLWTVLLGLFIRISGLEGVVAAKAFSALFYSGGTMLLTRLFWARTQNGLLSLWGGGLTAAYPTLVICMVSGMEVALYFFLLSALVSLFFSTRPRRHLYLGIAAGLLFVTRPENALWLPILLGLAAFEKEGFWRKAAGVVLGFGAAVLPWEIYLYSETGLFLPPTRTGKLLLFLPARYGLTLEEFRHLQFWPRLKLAMEVLKVLLSMKSGIIFFPFLVLAAYWGVRRQLVFNRFWLAGAAYVVGTAGLFIFFFPLVKLRYFVHLYPFAIFVSVLAFYHLWKRVHSRRIFWGYPFWGRAAVLVLLLLLPTGWYLAGREYARLARIQEIRTGVGMWLKTHTPADARIALEPIGGIGYHSGRYIIDLGGLVEPAAWPYMGRGFDSSPDSLFQFLQGRNFTHLVDYGFHQWAARMVDLHPERFSRVARFRSEHAPPPLNEYEIFEFQPAR